MASYQISPSVNWDSNNRHVDPNINEKGIAVQANTILIAVGAPTLQSNSGVQGFSANLSVGFGGQSVDLLTTKSNNNLAEIVWPVGTAENVGIGQNKQLQQFFEIGSKKRYFVPGRVVNSLQLNRVYLNGASILKVLWAYYNAKDNVGVNGWNQPPALNESLAGKVDNIPGYGHMWLNLASELFDKPIGMLLYFKDNFGTNVGAIYLENCNIANHSFGISASSTLFSESISMQFDQIKPVNIF